MRKKFEGVQSEYQDRNPESAPHLCDIGQVILTLRASTM